LQKNDFFKFLQRFFFIKNVDSQFQLKQYCMLLKETSLFEFEIIEYI